MSARLPTQTCTSCNRESSKLYCPNCISTRKRWTVPSYLLAGFFGIVTILFTVPVSGYPPFYLTGIFLGVATVLSIPVVRYWLATRTQIRLLQSKFAATILLLVILAFVMIPS